MRCLVEMVIELEGSSFFVEDWILDLRGVEAGMAIVRISL